MSATLSAAPTNIRFSAQQCAQFAQLLGEMFPPASPPQLSASPSDVKVPFTAPVLGFGRANDAGMYRFPAPKSGKIIVHEYQAIRNLQPLPTDQPLGLSLTRDQETAPGSPFGFHAEISHANADVITTLQTRLRQLETADFRRMRGTGLPRNIDAAALRTIESQEITPALVARYAALSNDDNPLHTDDEYAQAYGLERAIIPGMLAVGGLENMVAQALPDQRLCEVRVRFLAPILVGSRISFGLHIKPGTARPLERARIFILTEGEIVAAIADISLAPPQPSPQA